MKNDIKWILKKYSLRLLILFLILLIIWGIVRKKGGDSNAGVGHPANLIEEGSLAEKEKGEVDAELWEKGYQLPLDKDMRKEAEEAVSYTHLTLPTIA